MVKPSILPDAGKKEALKEAKGTEATLPAFAVIPLGTDLPPKSDDVAVEAGPVPVVTRPRKLGVCLCLTMLLTVLLIIGLAVAMFLGHSSGKYQFFCGVGYGDYDDGDYLGSHGDRGTLQEDVEVSPYEGYEQIEIPEQDYCERLTILHDFTVNLTAYRLRRSEVCYITSLDKDIVMGPEEFIERAEENPEFLTDHYETVHETYRVVLPELPQEQLDSGRMGFYIPLLCGEVESYWIEKIPEGELEAWEEYWDDQDSDSNSRESDSNSRESDSEEEDDDDDEFELPEPMHRRRRAVTKAKNAVKEIREFAGKYLSKIKIYKKEAVELLKRAPEI